MQVQHLILLQSITKKKKNLVTNVTLFLCETAKKQETVAYSYWSSTFFSSEGRKIFKGKPPRSFQVGTSTLYKVSLSHMAGFHRDQNMPTQPASLNFTNSIIEPSKLQCEIRPQHVPVRRIPPCQSALCK